MPFNPNGTYSLSQSFGTGTPPSNDFPPQVGAVLDDIATNLNANTIATVISTIAATFPSLVVGTPTGGNKGAGTANVQGTIYQNNSAVFVQTGNATGGLTWTTSDFGTITNGTISPAPATCLKQSVTNNGTLVISATSLSVGDVELLIVNGASATSLTFSGFSKTFTGDAYTTTNNNAFVAYLYGFAGSRTAVILKALQ